MSELRLFDGRSPIYVPSFDAWYSRYPRKQGKADARKRWGKMSAPERASAWTALDGWIRYASVCGTTFVPYASTWLNQCRWEDDAPEIPRPEVGRKTASTRAAIARLRNIPDPDDLWAIDTAPNRELG